MYVWSDRNTGNWTSIPLKDVLILIDDMISNVVRVILDQLAVFFVMGKKFWMKYNVGTAALKD